MLHWLLKMTLEFIEKYHNQGLQQILLDHQKDSTVKIEENIKLEYEY
jgi:hypothetical protein